MSYELAHNHLIDNDVLMSTKYRFFSGQPPVCNSFRTKAAVIQYQSKKDPTKFRWVDIGCGKTTLCKACGESYGKRKSASYVSLVTALWLKFPRLKPCHWVFTLPHDHPWHTHETHQSYSKLFEAVAKTINILLPGVGYTLILHNHSSRQPEHPHIHIHAIIFPVTAAGIVRDSFVPHSRVKLVYADALGIEIDPSVHMEFFDKKHYRQLFHAVRYNFRSPIKDFAIDDKCVMTDDYLIRMAHLIGVHRIRHYGWMANHIRAKVMQQWHIELEEYDKMSEWTLGKIIWMYTNGEGEYIEFNGTFGLAKGEVETANTLNSFIKYVYHPPNKKIAPT